MPAVGVGDIDLYYELTGQGPRLLSISGTGTDLRRRPNLFDTELSERFTILGYDQRGLGRSGKPDRPYSMAQYADDAAALMDAVGWTDARVVGVSFGGMVAQELALRHLTKVSRLALVSTTAGGAGGSSYPLHELHGLAPIERARKLLALDLRFDAQGQAADPQAAEAALAAIVSRARPMDPADTALALGAFRQLEARALHDTYDRLPRLTMPVAVFAGRYDGLAPVEAQRNLADRIAGATFSIYDGPHAFLMDSPDAIRAVGDFLEGA